jgi:5-methylcytosine-specific restriction protein A
MGRTTEAKVVDHIVPHRGDAALFWAESNWQSLCVLHHGIKTQSGK